MRLHGVVSKNSIGRCPLKLSDRRRRRPERERGNIRAVAVWVLGSAAPAAASTGWSGDSVPVDLESSIDDAQFISQFSRDLCETLPVERTPRCRAIDQRLARSWGSNTAAITACRIAPGQIIRPWSVVAAPTHANRTAAARLKAISPSTALRLASSAVEGRHAIPSAISAIPAKRHRYKGRLTGSLIDVEQVWPRSSRRRPAV